jgi:hypothetical protein
MLAIVGGADFRAVYSCDVVPRFLDAHRLRPRSVDKPAWSTKSRRTGTPRGRRPRASTTATRTTFRSCLPRWASTWRRRGSSGKTLKRTARSTASRCSSTWPTTRRTCAALSFCFDTPSLLNILGQTDDETVTGLQDRAHHHAPPGAHDGRIFRLPTREARPRHPDRHVVVRRRAPRSLGRARGGARSAWLPGLHVHGFVDDLRARGARRGSERVDHADPDLDHAERWCVPPVRYVPP